MNQASRTVIATLLWASSHCGAWSAVQGFDRENCTFNGTKLEPSACESTRADYEAQEAFVMRRYEEDQARHALEKLKSDKLKIDAERERLRPSPPPEKPVAHDWRHVEASNGSVYRVDLASVQRFATGAGGAQSASVMMYRDEGSSRDIHAQRLYVFDCKGRVQDATGMAAPTYIPPRSVAANAAALVCAVHPPQ
ncbi:MAG: hypothetical protein H7255_16875 [Ramlibacter sp.]|nr:hypothetical protein [Ramlibacter sp.]